MRFDAIQDTQIIYILLGSGIMFYVIRLLITEISSKSWPSTTGVVTSSNLKTDFADRSVESMTEVSYRYEVDNKEYISKRTSMDPFGTYGTAQRALEKYPAGKTVSVYYDPRNPEKSRFTTGVSHWTAIYLVAVPLICVAITGNLLVVLLTVVIAGISNLIIWLWQNGITIRSNA